MEREEGASDPIFALSRDVFVRRHRLVVVRAHVARMTKRACSETRPAVRPTEPLEHAHGARTRLIDVSRRMRLVDALTKTVEHEPTHEGRAVGTPRELVRRPVLRNGRRGGTKPSTSSRHTPYLVLSVKSTSRVQTLATPYTFLSNGFSLAT